VAEDIGVTARTIWFHISQSRKKGYKVEDFKGNNGTKEVSYHENEM